MVDKSQLCLMGLTLTFSLFLMKAMNLIISKIILSFEGLVFLSGCTRGQQGNFLAVCLTLSLARFGPGAGRFGFGQEVAEWDMKPQTRIWPGFPFA